MFRILSGFVVAYHRYVLLRWQSSALLDSVHIIEYSSLSTSPDFYISLSVPFSKIEVVKNCPTHSKFSTTQYFWLASIAH